MGYRKIKEHERKLAIIESRLERPTQEVINALKELAKQTQTSRCVVDSGKPNSLSGEVVGLVENIHRKLQTETMVNACITAKWSCIFAAIAAGASFACALAAWITVYMLHGY